ncbi:amidase family protein, partial [Streptosporangium algeriense]
IGVWRKGHVGVDPDVDRVFEAAVRRLRELGAVVVEGADVPGNDKVVGEHLLPAVLTEFKHDINAYLAATPGTHPKTLTGLIAFNRRHAGTELGRFGQELFEMADRTDGDLTGPAYREHRGVLTVQARKAIDDVLARHRLDAIVTPSDLPALPLDHKGENGRAFTSSTRNSAMSGYPHVTVPAGYTRSGLPLGLSFLGTRFTDARLLGYAHAFEQATHARRAPRHPLTPR